MVVVLFKNESRVEHETMNAVFQSLLNKCNEEKGLNGEYQLLLEKAKTRCNRYLQGSDCSSENGLQEYAQAVFDFTYIDENRLVEEEFPDETSKERIQAIFELLHSIENIAEKSFPDKELRDVLGSDIAECLMWRRGALMYMYCSTLQEKPTRVSKNKEIYIENLSSGIAYLNKLLSQRVPCGTDSEVSADKDDVQTLLSLGVYSDTHLLAMMYAGEMCYWYCSKEETEKCSDRENVKQTGIQLMQSYIKAVKGPLSLHGWSSQKAEEILKYFNG